MSQHAKMIERLNELFPTESERDFSQPRNPETGNLLGARLVNYLGKVSVVGACWPNVEYQNGKLFVRMWLDEKDRAKGFSARRLMKPGKAMKHLFPWKTDAEIESLVDSIRSELGEKILSLHVGKSADQFKHAYTHNQARMENPRTTYTRKSLANSCMRYTTIMHLDSEGDERHPAEAYASGEFDIVWVEDSKGNIAARCVVWTASEYPVPAPIYGTCEESLDEIHKYLKSINADFDGDWEGANLKTIHHEDSGFIAPYLDLEPRLLSHNGFVLTVDKNGDIDASQYNGVLNGEETWGCDNCGSRQFEGDSSYDVDNMTVCEDCFENSNYCERYDESTFQGVDEVFSYCSGRRHSEWWSQSAIDNYAVKIGGEYWESDCVFQDFEGNYFSPEQLEDEEYFYSDWDGEYYPIEYYCETAEGECVSRQELDAHPDTWEQNGKGVWVKV